MLFWNANLLFGGFTVTEPIVLYSICDLITHCSRLGDDIKFCTEADTQRVDNSELLDSIDNLHRELNLDNHLLQYTDIIQPVICLIKYRNFVIPEIDRNNYDNPSKLDPVSNLKFHQ